MITEATQKRNEEKRANEIWSGTNGESLCVSMKCMGANLFFDVVCAPITKAKTWNGAFRYTDAEREDMKDFLINEIGQTNPSCDCGRVAF